MLRKTRRRVWSRRAILACITLLACHQLWRHGRAYVLPVRFAEVEPGKLYRGAWQRDLPMRNIVRDHRIKTILALAHPPNHDLPLKEQGLAAELGVKWVHIPILDDPGLADGKSLQDLLDQAADVLGNSQNQPVYFHCHHGIVRASMVQVAYRLKYSGWNINQALAEIHDRLGIRELDQGADRDRLVSYYRERILPARLAAKNRSTSKDSKKQ